MLVWRSFSCCQLSGASLEVVAIESQLKKTMSYFYPLPLGLVASSYRIYYQLKSPGTDSCLYNVRTQHNIFFFK